MNTTQTNKGEKQMKTEIDTMKKTVDFRIISINCAGRNNYATIDWKDGIRQNVSRVQLKKLQSQYTYMTDF